MALFGRQVILQIGNEALTGKEYRGFRVDFRVEMSRQSTPNVAVIEAYNLNQQSVAMAQAPGAIVRLLAGYDVPLQIFRGNPVKDGVRQIKQGPDRILRIEAQDGQRQYQSARVSVSLASQATASQALSLVAAQLGLPTGTIRTGPDVSLPGGLVLNGSATSALDRLCATLGAEWFIRDGVLHVVPIGGTTGESAVIFSAASGNLIGSPTQVDGGVEITGLIAPTMRPGKPFRVISEQVNGDFIADTVVFQGSEWGQEFYAQIKGRPR